MVVAVLFGGKTETTATTCWPKKVSGKNTTTGKRLQKYGTCQDDFSSARNPRHVQMS